VWPSKHIVKTGKTHRTRLRIWGRAAEGDWWGLVTYPTTPAAIGSDTAAAAEAVSHWVPGHLVRPVGDSFTGPQPPF